MTHKKSAIKSYKNIFLLLLLIASAAMILNNKTYYRQNVSAAAEQSIGLGIYRPEYPQDLSSISGIQNTAGKKLTFIHEFAYWKGWKSQPDILANDLVTIRNNASIPFVTWEPWDGSDTGSTWSLNNSVLKVTNASTGKRVNDDYITSWANTIKNFGGTVFLRWGHEMHNAVYPWSVGRNGNTAQNYIDAWHHVHNIFIKNGVANVVWVWNPNTMGGTTEAAYQSIYSSVYPGDAYVDWVGLDIYNTAGQVSWGPTSWLYVKDILNTPYRAVTKVAINKKLILPEVATTPTNKDIWIKNLLSVDTLNTFPLLRGMIWFDINKELDWRLNSSATTFATLFKQSDYANNGTEFMKNLGIASITPSLTNTKTPTPTAKTKQKRR